MKAAGSSKTTRYHIPEDSSHLPLLHSVRTGFGDHTASYLTGDRVTYHRGVNRPRRETYVTDTYIALLPPPHQSFMQLPRLQ
jgi:hypothetical protein